jgi:GxxExxY protein
MLMDEDGISKAVIGAAIEVHRALGPGLLESVYERCLARELELIGVPYECQVPVRAEYKGLVMEAAYRMDMVVCDKVVLELKVVEQLLPIHEAQLLSYLRLTKRRLGLLLNFHVPVLKNGLKRVVNNL